MALASLRDCPVGLDDVYDGGWILSHYLDGRRIYSGAFRWLLLPLMGLEMAVGRFKALKYGASPLSNEWPFDGRSWREVVNPSGFDRSVAAGSGESGSKDQLMSETVRPRNDDDLHTTLPRNVPPFQ